MTFVAVPIVLGTPRRLHSVMRHLGLLLTFVIFPVAAVHAQSDGNAPLTLELPASTRALALGGAFALSGATADGLFYNPALVNTARGFGVDVQRYRSTGTLGTVSAARALGSGGLAMGLQVLSFGMLGGTAISVPDNADALLQNGPIGASEIVGTLGYARVIKGFRVGVAGKVIEQRIGNARDGTVGLDIGVVRRFFGITWGISGQNIGRGLTTGTGGLVVPLPHRLTFGASTSSRPLGPLDVLATAAVSRRRDGEIIPAGGIEISWWPVIGRTFTGRIGVRRVPDDGGSAITIGAAFTSDTFTFEYALEEFEAPGASHRFGVRWR